MPANFDIAKNFVEEMLSTLPENTSFIFAGHSLGTIYSTLFGLMYGVSVVNAECPGLMPLINQSSKLKAALGSIKIINFLVAPNVINTLHHQIGHTYRVSQLEGRKPTIGHVLSCLAGSLYRVSSYASLGAVPAVSAAASALKIIEKPVTFTKYAVWLMYQHSIENMKSAYCFSNEGIPAPQVISWPSLGHYYPTILRSGFKQWLGSLVPFNPSNRGIHTISKEADLEKRELAMLKDFEVKETQNWLQFSSLFSASSDFQEMTTEIKALLSDYAGQSVKRFERHCPEPDEKGMVLLSLKKEDLRLAGEPEAVSYALTGADMSSPKETIPVNLLSMVTVPESEGGEKKCSGTGL